MVDESTPSVTNMNCKGLSDSESELLKGMDGRV